jgi:hypothetical protein
MVKNDVGTVQKTFRVNHQLTIVASYTVRILQAAYLRGTIRRMFQLLVKGRFQTVSSNSQSILAVNGLNPPNTYSFTPQAIGPLRVIVGVALGGIYHQRAVDVRITR